MTRRFVKWGLYLCLAILIGAARPSSSSSSRSLRRGAEPAPTATQAGNGNAGKGKVLPIPEPTYPPITEIDARNAKAPPRFEVKPPKGAPNIVIVLLDDIGFAHSSAFGGPIHMPTAEKLAKAGLKYNRFHTSPCVRRRAWRC